MIFECGFRVAGPISAGMKRAEVRRLLGDFSEFKKSPISQNTTDDFKEVGVHVFYNTEDVIRGIEIFMGNVVVRGVEVLSRSLPELVAELCDAGITFELDDVGGRLPDFGIGIYAPEIGDVANPSVEAVYVEMM